MRHMDSADSLAQKGWFYITREEHQTWGPFVLFNTWILEEEFSPLPPKLR